MRKSLLAIFSLAALGASASALAQATKYPTKPIRIIVPYAPGGGADIVARIVAQKMSETFRQSVVIDNRAGAGGAIGSEMAVRAVPDGYTLAFVSGAYTTGVALIKPSYDPVNDITPIVMAGEASSLAVVHPAVPIKNVRELVDYAKANPGKLNYGSGGTGGFSHLITAYFELLANVRMTHIPYKGTGPALTDLLGGQLQVIFGSTPSTAVHAKSGKLRAIGVTSKTRSSAMPDVPPIADTVPGYYAPLLYGMWGPRGLSKDVVTLWNTEVAKLLRTADMKERLASAGIDPAGGPPAEFRDALKSDIERWQKVVRAAGIKAAD
ncbi:MAG TPA: tripartite tricarboxylate transporter substrate binding protein [Burkholderiales bacterium]|nr:tripartite tricarboxylate transporter substrate binding protein [Burkholderiales bacterium]